MKLFRRVSATIMGSLDNAVMRVENHDAVVEAGIKEIRKAAANSRVRLARVQKDGERLRQQREEHLRNEADWLRRAKQVGQTDEKRALECLRRKGICLKKITELDKSIAQHRDLEEKLRNEVGKIDAKLKDISMQRNQMKSRQSVAEASRILGAVRGDESQGIDDIFDRWESAIIDTEICNDEILEVDVADDFAYQFESAENDAVLKSELVELLANAEESSYENE